MKEHIVSNYDEDLNSLKSNLIEMGINCERQLFNAINLTLGLPFLRVSPDHGPNIEMMGKRKSITDSLKALKETFTGKAVN